MIAQDVLIKIKKKLEDQRTDTLHHITELESNDPFNLEAQALTPIDRTSPDDDAQVNEAHDRVMAQISMLKNVVVRLDSALERIADGSYGVCEACGKPIEESRLSIMPLASLCLADEKRLEKKGKKSE